MESENKESENVNNPPGEGELPPEEQEQELPPDPLSYIPCMEKLTPILGNKFINNKCEPIEEEQKIKSEVFSAKLIGLFFTGEWGSPCRIFRKLLVDLYNKANEGEKVLEIIEIECPKIIRKAIKAPELGKARKDIDDEEEKKAKAEAERKEEEEKFKNFQNDIAIKPWKFIPYKDPKADELKKFYNVTAIPQFFPIDKNGNIISNNARNELMEGGVDVIEEWINVLQDIYEEEHKNDKVDDANTAPIEEAKENKVPIEEPKDNTVPIEEAKEQ